MQFNGRLRDFLCFYVQKESENNKKAWFKWYLMEKSQKGIFWMKNIVILQNISKMILQYAYPIDIYSIKK